MRTKIDRLMETLNFGTLTEQPSEVKGGLLHKMFRVTTETGVYAVKLLNPEIMKRPDALNNMVSSEKAARALGTLVPAVSALERNEKQVHKLGEGYYLVYPWIDGKSVFPGEIREEHCRVMGEILGKIHQRNLKVEGICPEANSFERFQWDKYARLIIEQSISGCGGEWTHTYRNALEDIKKWNEEACSAEAYLSGAAVISHRDLDPKNVMWMNSERTICAGVIDWEAAGYVNPCQEFAELVHYWTDDGKGGVVRRNLEALVNGYGRYIDMGAVEWETVFKGSRMGMLGWLDYNVRRALGMEAADREEISLGEHQVVKTVQELYAYQKKMYEMLNNITMIGD